MRRRLFIAINLPNETERALSYETGAISGELPAGLNARFSDPDGLHFTILFLNSQEESLIPEITEAMRDAVSGIGPFNVQLTKIDYNPGEKRMIWAYGESPKMAGLHHALKEAVKGRRIVFADDEREFLPHITLARFDPAEFLPAIASDLDLEFQVTSLSLMESRLSEKPRYKVVQTIDLKGRK